MKKIPVTIQFETTLYQLKDWTILAVPKDESFKLPSRGQISVSGRLNGQKFLTVLEPDGRASHWLRVSDQLQARAGARSGDTVTVELTTGNDWPEPQIPADVAAALETALPRATAKWRDITPMARWEWIRWVNATPHPETRARRIEKTISKLGGSHRRPCCFNLTACTEPYVAQNGQLLVR